MKRIILIILLFTQFLTVRGQSEDPFYRQIDWTFYPTAVSIINDSTYLMIASVYDFNEPGAGLEGNYVVDNIGHRYIIVNLSNDSLIVIDHYRYGVAPQTDQPAKVYKSVGNGEALYVGSVDYSRLDPSTRWKLNGSDNELLYRHGIEFDSPFKRLVLRQDYVSLGDEPYGTTYWDSENHTTSTVLENGVTRQEGQELHIYGKNTSGAIIPNGRAVSITRVPGMFTTFELTDFTDETSIHAYAGVSTQEIGINEFGYITIFGLVHEMNTSSWLEKDELYGDWTSTEGELTNIEPPSREHKLVVGIVEYSHLNQGTIQLRTDLYPTVPELSGVNGTLLQENGQIMVWNEDSSYFDFDYNINGYYPRHGIISRDSSVISYNDLTRTITVTPVNSIWSYYFEGQKYDTTIMSVSHPNVTDQYFLYFDENRQLQFTTDYWNIVTDVMIASVYYNSTLSEGIVMDERHSADRNRLDHRMHHETVGTYKVSGLVASGYTVQPVSPTDADNTFALTSGVIADEDIRLFMDQLIDGSSYTTIYRSGVSGDWVWEQNSVPFAYGTYIQYNEYTGATWQLTDLSTNRYVNIWVCKIGAIESEYQTLIIIDQDLHSTADDAASQGLFSQNLGNFPFIELESIYKFTYRTNAAYTSTGKCRIYAVTEELGNLISLNAGTSSSVIASNVYFEPYGDLNETNAQSAIEKTWDRIDSVFAQKNYTQNYFRSGKVWVGAGNQEILFDTPFPDDDYILVSNYAMYPNKKRQNLSYESASVSGYTALGVIDSTFIHYLAVRNIDSLALIVDSIGQALVIAGWDSLHFENNYLSWWQGGDELGSVYIEASSGGVESFLFEKELSNNETIIDVGYNINSTSLVFINGYLSTNWSSFGTNLTLSYDISEKDYLIVNTNDFAGIFEDILSNDETIISLPFNLATTSLVFYNGLVIPSSRWSGEGTSTLTIQLNVYSNDLLQVKL